MNQYDGEEIWDGLWKQVQKNSKGLTVNQVLQTLRKTSDELFEAGLDDVYNETLKKHPDLEWHTWDITWLTLFIVNLAKQHE